MNYHRMVLFKVKITFVSHKSKIQDGTGLLLDIVDMGIYWKKIQTHLHISIENQGLFMSIF
jgi:hypothetical protein